MAFCDPLVSFFWIIVGPYWIPGSFCHWAFNLNCSCHCRALRDLNGLRAWKSLLVLLVGYLVGWKLGKMESFLGSSHLEGKLLVAEAYLGRGLAYGSD